MRVRVPMWSPGVRIERIAAERSAIVLVEPLYLGVAAALALDAGWGSVELAARSEAGPIPLVSFEQRPTQLGGRCRVRGDVDSVRGAEGSSRIEVLGSLVNARPLAARLAREELDEIDFVPVGSDGRTSADAWAVCGVLIRTLLDESERACELDDAAGIAVSLATDADDVASLLTTGTRWRRHVELGGAEDDLRVAAAVDSVGIVPRLDRTSGTLVATAW